MTAAVLLLFFPLVLAQICFSISGCKYFHFSRIIVSHHRLREWQKSVIVIKAVELIQQNCGTYYHKICSEDFVLG